MSEWIAPAPLSQDKYGSIVDRNGEGVKFRGVSTLCTGTDEAIAEAEANTTIATAAPDLLEALEDACSDLWLQIESKHGPKAASEYPSIVKAKAAIAKAKGTPC